jgi:hypothetical protein
MTAQNRSAPDPAVDRLGNRRLRAWRTQLQRPARTLGVVVHAVRGRHPAEVPLAEDLVGQLGPHLAFTHGDLRTDHRDRTAALLSPVLPCPDRRVAHAASSRYTASALLVGEPRRHPAAARSGPPAPPETGDPLRSGPAQRRSPLAPQGSVATIRPLRRDRRHDPHGSQLGSMRRRPDRMKPTEVRRTGAAWSRWCGLLRPAQHSSSPRFEV